jgi:Lon protease-like protein
MGAADHQSSLPVFPLTGTLMLPGTYLPLNVFEERYIKMVRDALAGDEKIGMIQPMIPGLDNWGVPPLDLDDPELYPVGCCGRIHQHELQKDGRFLIVLEGEVRFRLVHELKPVRGYRRVQADFAEFEIDRRTEESEIDTRSVLSVLDRFARQKELEFDPDLLAALSGQRLVNTLSTALPFSAPEKQALLEAYAPEDRASLLVTLMRIDLESEDIGGEPDSVPTIH